MVLIVISERPRGPRIRNTVATRINIPFVKAAVENMRNGIQARRSIPMRMLGTYVHCTPGTKGKAERSICLWACLWAHYTGAYARRSTRARSACGFMRKFE